jgi:hypothetical protein
MTRDDLLTLCDAGLSSRGNSCRNCPRILHIQPVDESFIGPCLYPEGTKMEQWNVKVQFSLYFSFSCRSQRPRGLRHELSSFAPMLGSWVRIPLRAWMFGVCVCARARLFCLYCPVCRQRPCDGLIPRPRNPTDYVYSNKLKKRPRHNKGL